MRRPPRSPEGQAWSDGAMPRDPNPERLTRRRRGLLLGLLVALVSCASASPGTQTKSMVESGTNSSSGSRQMVIGMTGEPRVLSATIDSTTAPPYQIHEFVSLVLTSIDTAGRPVPTLVN